MDYDILTTDEPNLNFYNKKDFKERYGKLYTAIRNHDVSYNVKESNLNNVTLPEESIYSRIRFLNKAYDIEHYECKIDISENIKDIKNTFKTAIMPIFEILTPIVKILNPKNLILLFIGILIAIYLIMGIIGLTLPIHQLNYVEQNYSMYPTITKNERIIASYWTKKENNDVIVLMEERGEGIRKFYKFINIGRNIKPNDITRIIGIEGDVVEIKNGKIYLNEKDVTLKNSFYSIPPSYDIKVTVQKNEIFVLDDNYNNIIHYGIIDKNLAQFEILNK